MSTPPSTVEPRGSGPHYLSTPASTGEPPGEEGPTVYTSVYWGTSRGSGSTVDTSATGEPPEGKWVTLSTPPSSGRQGDRLGAVLAEAVGTRYKMSQAAHLDVPGLKSQEFGNQPLEYNL